jgi:divalent metal cation (Fe/Co/Zn/Cd) transporter
MHEGSRRAIIAAFLANLGIALAKFVGFFLTGAASLLAEALHSVGGCGPGCRSPG